MLLCPCLLVLVITSVSPHLSMARAPLCVSHYQSFLPSQDLPLVTLPSEVPDHRRYFTFRASVSPAPPTTILTISLWLRLQGTPELAHDQGLSLLSLSLPGAPHGLSLSYLGDGHILLCLVLSYTTCEAMAAPHLADASWHHLLFTWDVTTDFDRTNSSLSILSSLDGRLSRLSVEYHVPHQAPPHHTWLVRLGSEDRVQVTSRLQLVGAMAGQVSQVQVMNYRVCEALATDMYHQCLTFTTPHSHAVTTGPYGRVRVGDGRVEVKSETESAGGKNQVGKSIQLPCTKRDYCSIALLMKDAVDAELLAPAVSGWEGVKAFSEYWVRCAPGAGVGEGQQEEGRVRCEGEGTWSDTCRALPGCAQLFDPGADTSATKSASVGSTAVVSCLSGLYLPPKVSHVVVTCGEDRRWSYHHRCSPIVCPLPVHLERATHRVTSQGNTTLVQVTCDEGFHLPDATSTATYECHQPTALWDAMLDRVPDCHPVIRGGAGQRANQTLGILLLAALTASIMLTTYVIIICDHLTLTQQARNKRKTRIIGIVTWRPQSLVARDRGNSYNSMKGKEDIDRAQKDNEERGDKKPHSTIIYPVKSNSHISDRTRSDVGSSSITTSTSCLVARTGENITELDKEQTKLQERQRELEHEETGSENEKTELQDQEIWLADRDRELEDEETELWDEERELEDDETELDDKDIKIENEDIELEGVDIELEGVDIELEDGDTDVVERITDVDERVTNTELEEVKKRETMEEDFFSVEQNWTDDESIPDGLEDPW